MDTIAAIATGKTAAAIGVLRISGPEADAVAGRVFRAKCGREFAALEPRTLFLGDLLDRAGRPLDGGMAVRFPGPGSYTGEDSAELHCHGSPVAMGELLAALFAAGARQARPGEFTQRAFLNGKLDLSQAEAVADLIDAQTPAAAENAAAQLGGALGRTVCAVYDDLTDLTARFYAVVDYPDEDIEDLQKQQLEETLRRDRESLERLLATWERGRVLKSGVKTAIVGRPNAGKSSLLNALAGCDRAIVTDVPGTTRDTVEESALCGGVLLRLIDTAGLRETDDAVERLGVERSKAALESAGLILVLWDGSRTVTDEDAALLKRAMDRAPTILVWTKSDLLTSPIPFLPLDPLPPVVEVSALTGAGLSDLEAAVAGLFAEEEAPAGEILSNPRHYDAVLRAREAVCRAAAALEGGLTPDAVLTDAEEAMDALGEITGRTAREEITAAIFSRFCVGK